MKYLIVGERIVFQLCNILKIRNYNNFHLNTGKA